MITKYENGSVIVMSEDDVQFYNPHVKTTKTLYSDRLYQEDHEKFNSICMEIFNDVSHYWYYRSAKDIQKFIEKFINAEIRLGKITVVKNASTGYPYWKFDYTPKNKEQ